MHKHHFYFGLVFLVLCGVAVFSVAEGGFYPIAVVNGKLILARDFDKMAESAEFFYARVLDTYNKKKVDEEESGNLRRDVERATLERLIEGVLITAELKNQLASRAGDLVDKKLQAVENQNLEGAARDLYGLSIADFREMVLYPEAEKEVLTDVLSSENKSFEKWLEEAKSEASTIVLLPGIK